MYEVTKVVLKGYREWTESLGDDREWKIQIKQAEIERAASEIASALDSFYLPTRKDVLLFITNNVNGVERLYDVLGRVSPVPIDVVRGCGRTPLEATMNATKPPCPHSEVVTLHVDINSFTTRDHYLGFVELVNLLEDLLNIGLGFGALGSYLGGDNVVLFASTDNYEELAKLIAAMYDVKVGVGIAPTARKALALAAKALGVLRSHREERILVLKGR